MDKCRIGIIGAGTVGLNTALEVKRVCPNAEVTIMAESFNAETTSDGAAGLFEINSSFRGPSVDITRQWLKDSFEFYSNLKTDSEAGISSIDGFYVSRDNPELVKNHYLDGILPVFREANHDELKSLGPEIKYATFMSTLVITNRMFLPWALAKLKDAGVFIKKTKVNSFHDIEMEYEIVFNCTGLGARWLCDDIGVLPIRGQVVKVEAPHVEKFFMHVENGSYIIPSMQSGLVTLGGTQDFGNWMKSPTEHNTRSILDRCCKMSPALESATVELDWVGLRPYRHETRVEIVVKNLVIVHNYGHGGYGVTLAPGSAKYAVNMIREFMSKACSFMSPSCSLPDLDSILPDLDSILSAFQLASEFQLSEEECDLEETQTS